MSLGETIKAARESRGMSIRALAESTRINERIVEGIEKNDFSGISAAIYGQGFIRLIANRLGLEPGPLLQEFQSVFDSHAPVTSEPVVGNYKAQETLFRERAGQSQLFQPSARVVVDADSQPRPVAPKPESPIQVTVSVATDSPMVHPARMPLVEPLVEPAAAPSIFPDEAPAEKETTVIVEAADAPEANTETSFQSLFAKAEPPAPAPAPAPVVEAPLVPPPAPAQAPAPAPILEPIVSSISVPPPAPAPAPAPTPIPMEEEEGTLFAQATRKPRPVSVDPNDGKPRAMTGVYVPPHRRKAESVPQTIPVSPAPAPAPAPAPSPAPVAAPAPAPAAPQKAASDDSSLFARRDPAPAPVQVQAPPVRKAPAPKKEPTGPSMGQRSAEAFKKGAVATGRSLTATFRGVGRFFKALGRGIVALGRALGRGFLATGRFAMANGRSLALVSVALVMFLLGIWAVLAIRTTLRHSRASRVVVVQKAQAPLGDAFVESVLPPPSIYAH